MNTYNNLIIVKDEDKTQDIARCKYVNGKYEVVFNTSPKVFSYNTVAGNHARGHLNQRQIDVIKKILFQN